MSRLNPFIVLLQRVEDDACLSADVVISLLPKADNHLALHGMDHRKFRYMPNGIAAEEWDKSAALPGPSQALLEGLCKTGRFLVCYAGSHGEANALDSVLWAAAEMRDEPVKFVLVGAWA